MFNRYLNDKSTSIKKALNLHPQTFLLSRAHNFDNTNPPKCLLPWPALFYARFPFILSWYPKHQLPSVDISERHSSRKSFWSVFTSTGCELSTLTRRIIVRWYCVSSDFLYTAGCVPGGSPVRFPSNISFFVSHPESYLSFPSSFLALYDWALFSSTYECTYTFNKIQQSKNSKVKNSTVKILKKPVSNIPKPCAEWPIYA